MKFKTNIRVFKALLWRDFLVFKESLKDTLIDSAIIVGILYIIYGLLLPFMGMNPSLVGPLFLGSVLLVLINIAYDRTWRIVHDLKFVRFIDYQITLPISGNWLLGYYICGNILDAFCATIPVFVLGRLLYGSLLNFSSGSYALFFMIYLFAVTIVVTGFLIEAFGVSFEWFRENTFARFLIPLTTLGCLTYPWKGAFKVIGFWAKILLLNPLTYMVEGFRSALIGTPNFLPVSLCASILLGLLLCNIIVLWIVFKRRMELS